MSVKFDILKKSEVQSSEDFAEVSALANKFRELLNNPQIENEIASVHCLGGLSTQIQAAVLPGAEALGFTSEKAGLFNDYAVSALRPDYYKKTRHSGVLLEVERGKTISNNMDILDFWKCHICDNANYLFLLVPQMRHAKNGRPTYPYKQVKDRLSTFFIPKNYVNVEGVFLFGY